MKWSMMGAMLAAPAFSQDITVQQAAKSPYDVASYVEAPGSIDWLTPWHALAKR